MVTVRLRPKPGGSVHVTCSPQERTDGQNLRFRRQIKVRMSEQAPRRLRPDCSKHSEQPTQCRRTGTRATAWRMEHLVVFDGDGDVGAVLAADGDHQRRGGARA